MHDAGLQFVNLFRLPIRHPVGITLLADILYVISGKIMYRSNARKFAVQCNGFMQLYFHTWRCGTRNEELKMKISDLNE